MSDRGVIMLSAGGTGGHLFPAEALAQALLKRGRKVVIVTDRRGEAFKSLGPDVPVHIVHAATLKAGIFSKIKSVLDMGIGIAQAVQLVRRYRPETVVGFGGYPSFPAVFAAQLMKVPTVLHEQNGVLGKANKALAGRATLIAASLPDTKGISPACQDKVIVCGNPVRESVEAVREHPYPEVGKKLRLLITGGSQGARILSQVVPSAFLHVPDSLRDRFDVVHQARPEDLAAVRAAYLEAGMTATVESFFADMPEQLSRCHVFIGRSGASTVAELAVVGRPALFIPLDHADRQQYYNAEIITKNGGGWLVPQMHFTKESLAQKLQEFLANPAMLFDKAAKARACGQPGAAARLADIVEQEIKQVA